MPKPLRALIVEDSEADVILLVRHLKQAGYELTYRHVETASELEVALAAESWDIVLSDFYLPTFEAFEGLKRVREISPHTPFIVVSGALSEERLVDVMRAGANDLILKTNLSRLDLVIERELSEAQFHRQHERTEESLQQSEQRFEHLYNNTPAMLYSADASGILIKVSDYWLARMGYERDEVLGRPIIAFMTAESADRMKNKIQPQFRRDGAVNDVELQFETSAGDVFDVSLSAIAESDANGSVLRSLVVLLDITEQKINARKLDELVKELRCANTDLECFAYVASHDLQEPLRKLEQFSEYLADDCADSLSKDGQYFLDVIRRSSSRMSRLIRDLLGYSRTANRDLRSQDIDLLEITEEILSDLEIVVSESEAMIHVDRLPVINGDATAITHLMRNLIGNAIKYRHPIRKPEIRIETTNARDGDGTCIAVVDNGIGFDMKFKDRIFEPFRRLHDKNTYPGSGIGLSVCNTICERHGWKLDAVSELDKGSTFVISIPPSDFEIQKVFRP